MRKQYHLKKLPDRKKEEFYTEFIEYFRLGIERLEAKKADTRAYFDQLDARDLWRCYKNRSACLVAKLRLSYHPEVKPKNDNL